MKRRYPAIGLAILVICVALYGSTRRTPLPAASPAPSAMVSFVTLRQSNVPVRIDGAGSVVAGMAEIAVTSAAPGKLGAIAVMPGQEVAAGAVLATLLPDPQSIAALRKAENAGDAALAARDHVAALLAQHLATAADLAAARQALGDAEADLASLRAAGTGVERSIDAPVAGTVTAILAAPGSLLASGDPVLRLAAAGQLTVQAGLTEGDAGRVRPGDAASLSLLNTGATLAANVLQVAAMLDPQTGLVDVTLLPQGAVLLGEPVAVTITAGSVTGDKVPRDAVLSDGQGDYVFELDSGNIAHRRNVQVLEADGGNLVLAPDLTQGARIAVSGAYQLSDGMQAMPQDQAP
jgi:RND family efflux transporter MFP subunit